MCDSVKDEIVKRRGWDADVQYAFSMLWHMCVKREFNETVEWEC